MGREVLFPSSASPHDLFRTTLSSLHSGEGLFRVVRFFGRTGVVPRRANGRWGRGEDLSPSLSVRHPTIAAQESGTYGDEGKAVGTMPPTALLFQFHRHENAA